MRTHLRILVLCLCAPILALPVVCAEGNAAISTIDYLSNQNVVTPPSSRDIEDADSSWRHLRSFLQQPQSDSLAILVKADRARSFYLTHKKHCQAVEARKLEALLLLDAVAEGQKSSDLRMQAAVKEFRGDVSIPSSQRAIVAGTYEFQMARDRIRSEADLVREYEQVARRLIEEFPDQPQGYISLLTQSMQRESASALAIAREVAGSAGPEIVRKQARRLVTRHTLVGQTITGLVSGSVLGETEIKWQEGKPGVIYFWATWNPDSVRFAEMLAARNLEKANVIGICIDSDLNRAKSAGTEHKLPGRLIYVCGGLEGDLADRLGAVEAPAVYLTATDGTIHDVRGLENIEAKLSRLGL
ncbi:MAG: hypothetical protein QM715_01460 [Nibricoccus sp.]